MFISSFALPPRLPLSLPARPPFSARRTVLTCTAAAPSSEPDVILIGSGLGSLCTAALLTAQGQRTLVLESHTTIGGAAHSFTRSTPDGPVTFESGPHLFSGLSPPSQNPLRDILQAANISLDVIDYDAWGVFLPDRYVRTELRPGAPLFDALLTEAGGPSACTEVASLLRAMEPLGEAATALPPAAIRAGDIFGTLRVITRFLPKLISHLSVLPILSRPFAPLLDEHVQDEFARNFLNLLCFLLAGVQADRIPCAEVAFMFREWAAADGASAILQRPRGGASALANALADAVTRDGLGEIRTRSHVERIIVENGRAVGVELRSGERIVAKQGVISGVSGLDVGRLLGDEERKVDVEMCDSFMHLHVAVKLTEELRKSLAGGRLEANYVSVEDWGRGVDARENVVLMSVPSAIDESVGPEGWAVVHAYTPAVEPYEDWVDVKHGSEEYERLKEERAEVLFRAVNKVFGKDVREAAEVVLIGTPLTHGRFLRRKKGSYGPMVDARKGGLGLAIGGGFEEDGLFAVGDSVFPGVGVPAVAGSAWMVGNALVDVDEHVRMLRRIGLL